MTILDYLEAYKVIMTIIFVLFFGWAFYVAGFNMFKSCKRIKELEEVLEYLELDTHWIPERLNGKDVPKFIQKEWKSRMKKMRTRIEQALNPKEGE